MNRMKRIIAAAVLAALVFTGSGVSACTLWAASGTAVSSGGSLIVKNRDWRPNHRQVMKRVSPEKGYRYYGIYAENGKRSGLKAGINEKGLVIVSASASSIPRKARDRMVHTGGVMKKTLETCASVEEAEAFLQTVYGPQFLLLADSREIAQVEIGPGGARSVKTIKDGVLYHTNHYLASPLTDFNEHTGRSSRARLTRIGDLLRTAEQPYTLEEFIQMTHDRHNGPDDSIERTGSSLKAERTLASWAVEIPISGPPQIYVRLMNPGEAAAEWSLSAEELFAENGTAGLL